MNINELEDPAQKRAFVYFQAALQTAMKDLLWAVPEAGYNDLDNVLYSLCMEHKVKGAGKS